MGKRKMMLISFMLFSLFFGAGNLIFPPFLGQNAGETAPLAIAAFLITAVLLPVLGVIVVADFDGLDNLARKLDHRFAIVFTVLIYLSIGPGLGIPRAASVPFEMAVAPYLPADAPLKLCMLGYSLVFFVIAAWLALTPNKLVERIGKVLTPSLLLLLIFLFVSFLFRGKADVAAAQEAYASNPMVKGFLEGYQTMDTIAALNFGLVISVTIQNQGVKKKKSVMRYTILAGIVAGTILSGVYLMLAYNGNEKFCRISYSGKRSLDTAVYRFSIVWRTGSNFAGGDFYSGLSDYLCGSDYFYFSVFLKINEKTELQTVGIGDHRIFLFDL